jgi:hypothetical protein
MKKILIIIYLNILTINFCLAQTDYSTYYNITNNYRLNSPNPESAININDKEALYKKAFSLNKPLAWDLYVLADGFFNSGNLKKGEDYLLKATAAGFNISETDDFPFIDSLLKANKNLKDKLNKNYNNYLRKNCDILNSIRILQLFASDQHIRFYLRDYSEIDTVFRKFRGIEIGKCDSINYFSLLKIMRSPNFNSSNLTEEAKFGIGLILTHSATDGFANPDTVFAILKKEMLKGVVSPEFYANSVDRYYMNNKGMNFYCKFYDETLPIYDIANVDKRRSEVWLYPLYFKFKWNKQLDKLPNDYKYDSTVGQ